MRDLTRLPSRRLVGALAVLLASGAVALPGASGGAADARPGDGAVAAAAPLPNTLYMNTFSSESKLWTLNPSTGAAKAVGSMGEDILDIAFNGPRLFAVDGENLYRVNPTTAATTVVGSLGIGPDFVNSLGRAPRTRSYLWAASGATGNVYKVSTSTGAATLVGNLGGGLVALGDVAVVGGVLYASVFNPADPTSAWLASVDRNTGAGTLIGDTNAVALWGLAGRNGVLYGAGARGRVFTIDTSTGAATVIGRNNRVQAGLARSD